MWEEDMLLLQGAAGRDCTDAKAFGVEKKMVNSSAENKRIEVGLRA